MSSKKEHITICSTSFAEYDRRMQRIADVLIDDGYDVSWVCRSKSKLIANKKVRLVVVHPMFSGGVLFYFWYNVLIFIKLIFSKSSLIYAVDMDTVLPCYVACKLKKIKLVFDAHEYFSEVPELQHKKLKQRIWEYLANSICPKIKNNITVSSSLAELFEKKYQTPYTLIRNIPFSKKKISQSQNKTDIVYLGVINQGRGIELAIQAMPYFPDKKLTIIGGGDLMKEMERLANKLEVNHQVSFLGFVAPEKIHQILSDAWIGINMLDNLSLSYYYSLANKFFDYANANLPSVNMDFPEYRSLMSEYKTGVLAQKYDLSSLKEAIQKLENPVFYKKCVENCIEAKKHWNWEKESKKLVGFMKNLQS